MVTLDRGSHAGLMSARRTWLSPALALFRRPRTPRVELPSLHFPEVVTLVSKEGRLLFDIQLIVDGVLRRGYWTVAGESAAGEILGGTFPAEYPPERCMSALGLSPEPPTIVRTAVVTEGWPDEPPPSLIA